MTAASARRGVFDFLLDGSEIVNIVQLMVLGAVLMFSALANADMMAVPLPAKPSHIPTIPAPVVPTSNCVGVSDAGIVACNAMWKWSGSGRFAANYQVEIAYTYDTITGTVSVLPAIVGDKYTRAFVATPGGRVCGQSTNGRSTYSMVAWQAGAVSNYGYGTLTDCDDLGRVAQGNQIYSGAWTTIPDVMAVLALSNSGDYVAAYVAGNHVSLWRASQHVTEDGCASPCMADLIQLPAKVVNNTAGTVAWYYSLATQPPLGFVDRLSGINDALAGAPWSGINVQGDVVGADKVMRGDRVVTTLSPGGGFASVSALGINSSGVIVGVGKYPVGTALVARAFVSSP